MLATERTVFGRPFKATPLWLWIAQRASGVLLGPLVLLHIWSPALAANRALNVVLLAVILFHGYSGLRRMGVKRERYATTIAVAWIWAALVVFFGGLIILTA